MMPPRPSPSGESRTTGDETRFKVCPVCGHAKWSVSQNITTGTWYCYKCGAKGGGDAHIRSVADLFKVKKAWMEWPEVPLPEYTDLSMPAREYLRERGLTNPGKYGIVEVADTTRLLFPYLGKHGAVIFWSTRAYQPDGHPKYVTASGRHPLYVLPEWKPQPYVVIVEGILDAIMTHEYTGAPVIALGGKVLPDYLKEDLRTLAPGRKTVMLDRDAFKWSLKLVSTLTGAQMIPLTEYDPAKLFGEYPLHDQAIEAKRVITNRMREAT